MSRSYRSALLAAVAAFVSAQAVPALHAQSDYSNRLATSYLTAGVGFAGGASMTLDPPLGLKVAPQFSYRITAETAYPLSPSISAMLGLGLDNRSYKVRNESNTDFYTTTHGTYFSVTPGFSFSAFYVGMNFGFPMSGSYSVKAGSADEVTTDMSDADFSKQLTLVEPRIGAVIPLMNNKTGWLSLSVIGSITLGEVIDRPATSADNAGDYTMVTGMIGLSYQFSIPGTGK